MPSKEQDFIPAAGSGWLLPFYDCLTWLLGVKASHQLLLEQAEIQPGYHVLEIGCGTGNLTILAKRLFPAAEIVGIDPDVKALSLAQKKARRKRLQIEFKQGFAEQLSFPDSHFDKILSAFMLHHVKPRSKPATLKEAFRLLKPGGSLHLADFAKADHHQGHHFDRVSDREKEASPQTIPGLMTEAGFIDVSEVSHQANLLGRIGYYKSVKPL